MKYEPRMIDCWRAMRRLYISVLFVQIMFPFFILSKYFVLFRLAVIPSYTYIMFQKNDPFIKLSDQFVQF